MHSTYVNTAHINTLTYSAWDYTYGTSHTVLLIPFHVTVGCDVGLDNINYDTKFSYIA